VILPTADKRVHLGQKSKISPGSSSNSKAPALCHSDSKLIYASSLPNRPRSPHQVIVDALIRQLFISLGDPLRASGLYSKNYEIVTSLPTNIKDTDLCLGLKIFVLTLVRNCTNIHVKSCRQLRKIPKDLNT
jgi:hypothetical protein